MEEFFDFEESLQSYYTNENFDLVALKRPRLGKMCTVKYNEDERWYRAIIKELHYELNQLVVLLVDYGNELTVPIDGDCVLKLQDQFKHYPRKAHKCCLNGVKSTTEFKDYKIKKEIVTFMYDVLSGRMLLYFVGKYDDSDFYLVNIDVEQRTKLA